MEDYLKVIAPHLHPDLVSPSALSQIQALAKILPSFPYALLECRLGVDESQVDFQVSLPRSTIDLPKNFLTNTVWQLFHNFCQEWVEPTSFLKRSINRVWLEFDVDRQPLQVPIPCIFIELNSETEIEAFQLIEIIDKLFNYQIPEKMKSNLRLCFDSLPVGAKIRHLGAMLSRKNQTLRVNVVGISPHNLLNNLDKIGWVDETDLLESLVGNLSDVVDSILLSFDIGDTVYPKIGVECFLQQQPKNEPRWQLFLDFLVKKELCTIEKHKALLAWPGLSQQTSQTEFWPINLTWSDRLFSSKMYSFFWRTINHIKIVYQPGSPLQAKGYLAFAHCWLERDTLSKNLSQQQ